MGIALIKKINEKTPYFIKRPFSKIIRNKLIKNQIFMETLKRLDQYEEKSIKEKESIQIHELKKTLLHAYEHTKYYKRLFDEAEFDPKTILSIEDLKRIPVLTKKELKNNFDDILADDIDDFYLVTTGGSTGQPIKIQMEKNAIYKEWAYVYHYWNKFGYDYKSSRLATFRGVDLSGKLYEINPLYNEIRINPFIMSESNIEKCISELTKYGVDFIYGYPSSVYNFCRLAKKKNIALRGKYRAVFLISENLYDFQECEIRNVLGCDIAMFYGHSERAVFAEKYNGIYKFNHMYGITEIGEQGELVVTGFINQKTPLIRYSLDDMVKNVDDKGYIIEGHRTFEVLYGLNGEEISSAATIFHDDTFNNVSVYQFVQSEKGKCELHVVAEDESTHLNLKLIQKRVQDKLGPGISCKVIQKDSVIMSSRGKYQMIIQSIK